MTAEEFFRSKIKALNSTKEVITLSQELITGEQGLRWAHEFTATKVKEALEAATEKAKLKQKEDGDEYICYINNEYGETWVLDKDSILNAYDLNSII